MAQNYMEVNWNLPLSIPLKEKGTVVDPDIIKSSSLRNYTILSALRSFTFYFNLFLFLFQIRILSCLLWLKQKSSVSDLHDSAEPSVSGPSRPSETL